MKELVKRALPIFTALFALVWMYFGFAVYGFWDARKGPLGGFFPILVAALMLVASLAAIVQANREKPPDFRRESLMLIVAVFMIFIASFVVGMLPALALFLVGWLHWVEKYPWRTTLTVSLVIFAVVFGVFVLWLNVRFPAGMLSHSISAR